MLTFMSNPDTVPIHFIALLNYQLLSAPCS